MKKIIFPATLFIVFLSLFSCDPQNIISEDDTNSDTLDYVWDSTKVVTITLSDNGISVSDKKKVSVSGNIATISDGGSYEISGSISNGQIIVNSDELVRLILKNANITNTSTSPIFVQSAKRAIVILPENTDNNITDGSNYNVTSDSLNAAIYSKDYLAFYGTGKITVTGNYNHAISAKDELVIESGTLNINAVGSGIRAKDYLQINEGNITVNSSGDALKTEHDNPDKGYVEINGGEISLTTSSDGISATGKVTMNAGTLNITTAGGYETGTSSESTKGIKGKDIFINGGTCNINSADNSVDANNNIQVNGGTLTLYSGNKAFDSDSTFSATAGEINILYAEKGLNSHSIDLKGGKISVATKNDCIKASLGTDATTDDGSSLNIEGATVLLSTSKGDALDSNGSISVKSGTVVVQASQTSPDDIFTYRGTCQIDGGTVVAAGAASLLPQNTSAQKVIYLRFSSILSPNTVIRINNASNEELVTFKTAKYAYYLLVSVPTISNGTYSVYKGGSVSGTDWNGYYNPANYSTGTLLGTVTVSDQITTSTL